MHYIATPRDMRARFVRWALFLAPLILLLGQLSGYLAGSGEDNPWFAALEKPALYPPSITFPVTWTVLYLLMGVALALILAARPSPWKPPAIITFVVQLALNLAWSPVFFDAHAITLALVIIAAMDIGVIATIVLFARIRKLAAWLLVPYLAWIIFATGLTWQILQDNPQADGMQPSGAVQRVPI